MSLFSNYKTYKNGFTLAEVLITLGIIGVVAVMVVPVLISSVQDITLRAAWKKNYSMFVQAYARVKYDNGNNITEFFPDSGTGGYKADAFIQQMQLYLKPIVTCYTTPGYICGAFPLTASGDRANNVYKTLNGGYLDDDDLPSNQCVLANGVNVYSRTFHNDVSNIYVDVNGFAKGPNILGKDLFGMILTKDKISPMGAIGTERTAGQTTNCTTSDTYIPIGASLQASNYNGAACSMTFLYN